MLLLLASCNPAVPVDRFAGTSPDFDPLTFFTGHTASWGVLENRDGAPTGIVTTDCVGTAEGTDGLRMVQRLTLPDGSVQQRDWVMHRTAPHDFTATANDMDGEAHGHAAGRVFHWSWVLETSPGNTLKNVLMSQWMYYEPNGTMVNRTTISKLGVILAEVTEQFAHTP